MNKKLGMIMIAALITMLSVDVFAQGHGKGFDGERGRKGFHHRKGGVAGKGHFFERMKKALELTDSQIKKIDAIHLKYKKNMLELKEQLAPKEIQKRRLVIESKVDLTKVESLLKEISLLRYQMRLNRIKHRLEIINLLTDEQKLKLRNMKGKMRAKGARG